jgi:ATP-dependent Clp protease ATP-binding subunit ClpB
VLLQVLDDGRLTDGQGRTVDFRNTLIIMTSNIGSARILDFKGSTDGRDYERMKEGVLQEMRNFFRPEFLNRVDETVVFHSLGIEDLKRIVYIQLQRLRARLAERQLELEITPAALEFLSHEGFDPAYGARPLKRAIQREIETPLAKRLLAGEIHDGRRVYIDAPVAGGGLTFSGVPPAPQEAGTRRTAAKVN